MKDAHPTTYFLLDTQRCRQSRRAFEKNDDVATRVSFESLNFF